MFGPGSSRFLAPRLLSDHMCFFHVRCFSSTVPGFAPSPCLLGQGLHRRLRADSLAIAAFPASFFATIPSYDFLPFFAIGLSLADLSNSLPLCGNGKTSLGHVIVFPPKPVLLTFEAYGGIGRSLFLQGCPASPANMVLCRLFRGLPSHPPHPSSRTEHYESAMRFRHLAVRSGLSPVSTMRCQALKKNRGKPPRSFCVQTHTIGISILLRYHLPRISFLSDPQSGIHSHEHLCNTPGTFRPHTPHKQIVAVLPDHHRPSHQNHALR